MAHANDNTPDPTTAVIMCELVVQTVPVSKSTFVTFYHIISIKINKILLYNNHHHHIYKYIIK